MQLRPAAPLETFVDLLWWSRRAAPYSVSEHMLPTGTCQLVIALHDRPVRWAPADAAADWRTWRHGIVHGPQATYYRAGPKPAGAVIGAAFRPGAAGAVLGVPAAELVDRHVTLEELWGPSGRALQERLAACRDPRDALRALERALVSRIRTPLLMHPAVAHALHANSKQPIERLCQETGYSHRHFVALFRTAVGLTPKHYFRLRRFSSAARVLAAGGGSLAGVAAQCGYADQAHFTREFRAFCGAPPSAYRPRSSGSPFHHVAG